MEYKAGEGASLAGALFSKQHALPGGETDIGEQNVAVAAKWTSAFFKTCLNQITNQAKWCLDCLGWLGLLGWLAWLFWFPWQATLEASEGPNRETHTRQDFPRKKGLFGVLRWDNKNQK